MFGKTEIGEVVYSQKHVDILNDARVKDIESILGEINKIRDLIHPEHSYKYHSGNWTGNSVKFVCTECDHSVVVPFSELNDGWVKLIVADGIGFYMNEIKPWYEEQEKAKEKYA